MPPGDGDRIQSTKHCVLNKNMVDNFRIVIVIYHRHKPMGLNVELSVCRGGLLL
jgi:hypothetical protein